MRALVLLLLASSALAQSNAGANLSSRIVEECEGQVCYLRCSGNQRLAGTLTMTGTTRAPIFMLTRSGNDFASISAAVDANFAYLTGAGWRIQGNTSGTALYLDTGAVVSAVAAASNALTLSNEGARVSTGPDTNLEEQGTRIRARQGVDGTAGAGTGLTANQTSAIAHQVHKITVDRTALFNAALTDLTIWTTPANTRLIRIVAEVTQVFTGGALSAMTVQCGSAAGGNQYLLANSVFTAVNTWGDVQAEIGAGLLSATVADMGTSAGGIPGAIAISCRFTCTGANCSAATQGSVTFQIEHVVYP